MRYVILLLIVAFCCDARHVPEDGVYAVAENLPEFGKGTKELDSELKKRIEQYDLNKEGTVFVSFVVDSTGAAGQYKVVRSENQELDSIALDIFQSLPPRWSPGTYDGKPVNVKMVYPVKFK